MRANALWSAALVTSQAGDLLTTWLGLRAGIAEDNPLVRSVLANGDFLLFGAVKLALVTALLVLALRSRWPFTRWGLQLLAVGFTAVTLMNGFGLAMKLA
jgi:uncharacterized protein DUF5658